MNSLVIRHLTKIFDICQSKGSETKGDWIPLSLNWPLNLTSSSLWSLVLRGGKCCRQWVLDTQLQNFQLSQLNSLHSIRNTQRLRFSSIRKSFKPGTIDLDPNLQRIREAQHCNARGQKILPKGTFFWFVLSSPKCQIFCSVIILTETQRIFLKWGSNSIVQFHQLNPDLQVYIYKLTAALLIFFKGWQSTTILSTNG